MLLQTEQEDKAAGCGRTDAPRKRPALTLEQEMEIGFGSTPPRVSRGRGTGGRRMAGGSGVVWQRWLESFAADVKVPNVAAAQDLQGAARGDDFVG